MIELEELPPLRDTVMIAAFEGWNDAGEAATGVVEQLSAAWGATPVAALDPEEYYDFQVNRPRVVGEGGHRRISWNTTRILLARATPLGRDVLFIHGVEPSFRWRAFAIELMELAKQADVRLLVTVGALMADVAHTRPIPVTVTSDQPHVRHRFDLEASTYEGPTGIVGVLADAAVQVDIPSVSAWAAIPHYAGHAPSPKAMAALISRLESLLGIAIDHAELDSDGEDWQRGVDEIAAGDPEIGEYVEALEEAQDTVDLPEASGEAIAEEFERYLRKRGDESTP